MKSILLIEDDKILSRGISIALQQAKFCVHISDSIKTGLEFFHRHTPDLIILDLNLPDGDGLTLCREIRAACDAPIIMLTARDLEADELIGLSAGADDYITKPFSIAVLRARVEAVLRRLDGSDKHKVYAAGFTLDTNLCKLFRVDGEEISISTTEFRLLSLFMTHVGKVLPKDQILAQLWDDFADENTLTVNISRLRSKIEPNPRKPEIIKTIHGIGYAWVIA